MSNSIKHEADAKKEYKPDKLVQITEWVNEKLYPVLGPPPLGPYENNDERMENENAKFPQQPEEKRDKNQ